MSSDEHGVTSHAMTTTAVHPYVDGAARRTREPPQSAASRGSTSGAPRALERANALAVPTTRDEEWRFTDITPLTRVQLPAAPAAPPGSRRTISRRSSFPKRARGSYSWTACSRRQLSARGGLPGGIAVDAPRGGARDARRRDRAASRAPRRFRARRLRRAQHGAPARRRVRRGSRRTQACATPVHLLFISRRSARRASYPRCLVVAEAGARVHGDRGVRRACRTTPISRNAVTEIVVGRERARAARAGCSAKRAARSTSRPARSRSRRTRRYASQAVTLGARLSRYDLNVLQNGEGARGAASTASR